MSTSRHLNKICIAAIAITLVITILFMCGNTLGIPTAEKGVKYESTLFDTSYVHKIDIVMDDWDSFIENCENEEYASCTVVVDGQKHSDIAIRAKGNTSLSSVKAADSQRYSFKLEFDHFMDGKTLDGLDKLCLNNLIQDNTMMKDYITYRMMDEFGVDSPLCSYAYLTVNGEDWGLYLAVEGIEDSFLSRSYGAEAGDLYKPDSMSFGGGRGHGKDFNMDDFDFGDAEGKENQTDGQGETEAETENGDLGAQESEQNGDEQFPRQPGGSFPGQPDGESSGQSDGSFPTPPNGGFPGQSDGESSDQSDGESSDQSDGESSDQSDSSFPTPPDGGFPFGDFNPGSTGSGETESDDSGRKPGGMPFGGGMGSSDVKLKYMDDDPDSYANIFDSAKTKVSEADKNRLIESLEKLSSYTDLEDVLDMDEVLRYFVIHNFVCNDDSYTGMMVHNYYLHEGDGKLSMIPWDYNLAYGTFSGNDPSGTVNKSIDSPVSGSMDDRPMLGWIFSDESYTDQYHELFSEFLEQWIASGRLGQMISDTADMIRPYVEKDPTKFCSVEEFDKGVSALSEFVSLRAEAVSNQLEGDDTPVDTGDLDLTAMGGMGGGMGGNMPASMPDNMPGSMPENMPGSMPANMPENMPENMPANMPENMSGNMPEKEEGSDTKESPGKDGDTTSETEK